MNHPHTTGDYPWAAYDHAVQSVVELRTKRHDPQPGSASSGWRYREERCPHGFISPLCYPCHLGLPWPGVEPPHPPFRRRRKKTPAKPASATRMRPSTEPPTSPTPTPEASQKVA